MRRLLFALLALAAGLSAGESDPDHQPVKASLIAETKGFTPGQALTVALRLEQEAGWHTYWMDPGDAGLATTVDWKLPAGVKAGPLLWPRPMTFKDPGGLVGYGYKDQAVLLTEITVPAIYQGDKLVLEAQANWLVCREVCIPGDAGVTLVLPRMDAAVPSGNAPLLQQLKPSLGGQPAGYQKGSGPGGPRPSVTKVADASLGSFEGTPVAAAAPGAEPLGLVWILLSAFLGGLLLNLMPCVLPVLSLKALSFVEQAKESRSEGLRLAAAFAGGVFFSFWVLAAIVLALKSGGQAVGWGFQFQEPAFVLFMAALMLVFALNLFGVYEIWLPGHAMQGLSQQSQRQGLAGAFGHGLVMTLLATPCSAPFLGTALGFAFVAPAYVLVLTFSAVALGLALPYLLLALIPASHAWLPKPGNWMLRFKEVMGFLLLATLVWLLWVLGKQVGVDGLGYALAFLLILAAGAWAWGVWGSPVHSAAQRWRLGVFLVLFLALAGAWALPKILKPAPATGAASLADGWVPWDAAEVSRLQAAHTPVFVDFGADWCWTCKVNEKAVLEDRHVKDALAKAGAVLMKADWTRRDAAITAALRAQGRSGVPMYEYYPANGPMVLFPELLTQAMVLKAIEGN